MSFLPATIDRKTSNLRPKDLQPKIKRPPTYNLQPPTSKTTSTLFSSFFLCKITKNSLTLHTKGIEKAYTAVKINKMFRYPLSVITALAIWVVCMIPIPETPLDDVSFIDKWTHFVMYGTLTVVIWVEYALRHKVVAWRRLTALGVVLPVVMGCAVELAQAYLTTCRSGDWIDALCNAMGVLLGAAIGGSVICYRQRG